MQQQQMVLGLLAGLEQNSISVQARTGEIKVYPRRELDVSLDWVFENTGKRIMCLLRDGVVTEVKTL